MPLVGPQSKNTVSETLKIKYTVETAKGVGSVLGFTQLFGSQGPRKTFSTTNEHQESHGVRRLGGSVD